MTTSTFRNYISGEWVGGTNATVNRNPSDINDVIGEYAQADAAQVRAAVAAAKQAFPAWATGSIQERANILDRAGNEILARKDELGRLLSREEGKTLPESKAEVKRAINIFRYFGGEGARQFTYHIPSERENVVCYTIRKPLGVVGLITPWNFPSAIPAWKMAPALVAGNVVIIKPASQAPLSAYRLVEALHETGIPSGVINFVTGGGDAVGSPLVDHAALKAISFTGSCGVGKNVYDKVTKRRIRVQLEMGGKNPTVVLKDANLDYAADILVNGAFFSTGQKCTACSRAIIEKPAYEALVEKLLAKTRKLKMGNGLDANVDIGPAVDGNQLKTDLEYIEIAKKEGAQLLCGGTRLSGGFYDKGYFIEPTIFANVTPGMRIAQEEVFGPVLALMVADDFEDAMRLANGVKFGLSASIVSKDLTRVHQFINRIESGLICVNLPTAGVEYQLPFGGTKESSFGMREQGPQALDFYTETSTVYMKYAQ